MSQIKGCRAKVRERGDEVKKTVDVRSLCFPFPHVFFRTRHPPPSPSLPPTTREKIKQMLNELKDRVKNKNNNLDSEMAGIQGILSPKVRFHVIRKRWDGIRCSGTG
jgi:hypothetical protein